MGESIFVRVGRLISAGIEDAVDAMERAGGSSVMREAIREVDRVIDEVRAEQEAAMARRLQAVRQQRMLHQKVAELDEKARFAIAENRDDLAEAAVARQLEFEAQAGQLNALQTEAAGEETRLEECLTALTMRKSQMEEALSAFETARREAAIGGDGPARPNRGLERKVERAEEAFERAMAAAGGASGISRADARAAEKVAQIAVMQKSAAIAQRMAALRTARDRGCGPS